MAETKLQAIKASARWAMLQFAATHGFKLGRITETSKGRITELTSETPDGQRFGIGYKDG